MKTGGEERRKIRERQITDECKGEERLGGMRGEEVKKKRSVGNQLQCKTLWK